jgi:ABC-type multidrug transport system ATPase subunit
LSRAGSHDGQPGRQTAASVIEASELAIGYRDEVVVPELDLNVPAGGSLALVGTNGSGKSTLIRTLVGLLPSLAGRLRVLGTAPG